MKISGVYTDKDYTNFIEKKIIQFQGEVAQIQPNSIDLSIGRKLYRVQSSFLPHNKTVEEKLSELSMYEIDLNESFVLEKHCIYIIPLNEQLQLPESIKGKCNPKSSTGRLDIFTRVICDYAKAFDSVDYGYKGKLYLEIMPRSFSVRIYPNYSFVQLRLSNGDTVLSDNELAVFYNRFPLLYNEKMQSVSFSDDLFDNGLIMRLSLDNPNGIVGFRAKKNSHVIDLKKLNHYQVKDYWESITSVKQLILEPEEFYIFRSKERIVIPAELCADMQAYEVSFGELRTHYAGFFDSGFGLNNGAHIVMEVRSHDIPYLVEDGQKMFAVRFERNLNIPNNLYGNDINSHYQFQSLKLAKQFDMSTI